MACRLEIARNPEKERGQRKRADHFLSPDGYFVAGIPALLRLTGDALRRLAIFPAPSQRNPLALRSDAPDNRSRPPRAYFGKPCSAAQANRAAAEAPMSPTR